MKYRTIVADPPWPIDDFPEWADGTGTIPTPYPTMTLDDIAALPVKKLANNRDADAELYLWTINEFLPQTFQIVTGWGFDPVATLVWCKEPRGVGLGGKFASNVEFVLYCRRPGYVSVEKREPRPDIASVTRRLGEIVAAAGVTAKDINAWIGTSDIASWWLTDNPLRCAIPKPEHWEILKERVPTLHEIDAQIAAFNAAKGLNRKPPSRMEERVDTRWFRWPRGSHSKKPEAFLDMVERVSPGPYLELFARRNRLGWDTWGNEALNHVELGGTG